MTTTPKLTPQAAASNGRRSAFLGSRPSLGDCCRRWPRVVSLLKHHALLSTTEAACCLRDYLDGASFSCEAVSHAGLTPAFWVRDTIASRASLKAVWPQGYRSLLSVHRTRRTPTSANYTTEAV